MKISTLVIGIFVGALIGFGLTRFFLCPEDEANKNDKAVSAVGWEWDESLDAVKAAPKNHDVVYEDSNMRVLMVSLEAGQSEPIHTHKWKSVMWISKPITPCKIYNYKRNGSGALVVSDSVLIAEMPVNKGQMIDSEGPTAIKNLSGENGVAYRVEFKKDFKR